MLWSSVEVAVGLACTASSHSSRMWINILALTALSVQHSAGTVLRSSDPLASQAMVEMYRDAEVLFRWKQDATTGAVDSTADLQSLAASQLSFADALRQIPSSDFRAWAVGLVRLAEVQAQDGRLQCDELDEVF